MFIISKDRSGVERVDRTQISDGYPVFGLPQMAFPVFGLPSMAFPNCLNTFFGRIETRFSARKKSRAKLDECDSSKCEK